MPLTQASTGTTAARGRFRRAPSLKKRFGGGALPGWSWVWLAWLGWARLRPCWRWFSPVCILFYNAIHKIMVVAPVLMGGCRFLVYLAAASVGLNGVTGESIWKGLALAGYIVGLSSLARKESAPVRIQYWPCIFLAAPLLVAGLADDGPDQRAAALCSVVLILWVVWTLLQTLGREHPNIGRAISRLLAGIALVDLLAVADLSQTPRGDFPGLVFAARCCCRGLFRPPEGQ